MQAQKDPQDQLKVILRSVRLMAAGLGKATVERKKLKEVMLYIRRMEFALDSTLRVNRWLKTQNRMMRSMICH